MSKRPKLRGGTKQRSGPYPLGEIPRQVALNVGKQIVQWLAVGHTDIKGDDFGTMFANAIEGSHKSSPLGLADVVWEKCAWTAKTVKNSKPFEPPALRLVSGRNSPDFSFGISNPREDIQETGRAVLAIWNERVNQALSTYDDLRVVTLVRNMNTHEFALYEDDVTRYTASDYKWEVNQRGNFDGCEIKTGNRQFTWQPHGSQFTIHKNAPVAVSKFRIKSDIPVIDAEEILRLVQFDENWIEFQS